jgi:hypothetical protein
MYAILGSNKIVKLVQNRLIQDCNLTINECISNIDVYKLVLDYNNIYKIGNIFGSYEYILLSSLNVIDITKKYILHNNINTKYLVVGKSSFEELRQYTTNQIYYPVLKTGFEALIQELLHTTKLSIIDGSNLLILSSSSISQRQIIDAWQPYFNKVDLFSLYNINYSFDILGQYIDKITYIVINSSGIIVPLIYYLQSIMPQFRDKLSFITYHHKIYQILTKYKLIAINLSKN